MWVFVKVLLIHIANVLGRWLVLCVCVCVCVCVCLFSLVCMCVYIHNTYQVGSSCTRCYAGICHLMTKILPISSRRLRVWEYYIYNSYIYHICIYVLHRKYWKYSNVMTKILPISWRLKGLGIYICILDYIYTIYIYIYIYIYILHRMYWNIANLFKKIKGYGNLFAYSFVL